MLSLRPLAGASVATALLVSVSFSAFAQEQAAASNAATSTAAATASPAPLSADEMEILVARIALYPDDLVAVISAASLYPLQIVEAQRFLDGYNKDKTLKPKESWDGSVISLLNYPEIVKMMSDDLDWTQTLGEAIAYQQKDVLLAIQQLRGEAVAKGVIKTDDKVKVEKQADNIVIQPASADTIYVPRYDPKVLYVANYPPAPVAYYPDPYPYYYNPTAPFFAGAVTGAVWAAAVDWDDRDVWGGHWSGPDINIDCDRCLNNIDLDGKVNFNDIDWKNVDRSKIKIDKDQFAKFDRTRIKGGIAANGDNALRDRAGDIKRDNAVNRPGRKQQATDIRKNTLEGLKAKPGGGTTAKKTEIAKRDVSKRDIQKPGNITRPVGKVKPAAKLDSRPKKMSGLGDMDRGKISQLQSDRGRKSLGGGQRGGAGKAIKRPAGHRR
ncbi:DUF3300 domain-containing protein [Mesorhizobium sp. NZP2298]|uniref:DUF3300 domain-containing protein n=1 Tax=Mesorhizobium sp. NZP2298 TaxID=2483403 RepID=UPI004040B18B